MLPKCMASSKTGSYHLILVDGQEQSQESISFCGPLGDPSMTTLKEFSCILGIIFVGVVRLLINPYLQGGAISSHKGYISFKLAIRWSVSNDFYNVL